MSRAATKQMPREAQFRNGFTNTIISAIWIARAEFCHHNCNVPHLTPATQSDAVPGADWLDDILIKTALPKAQSRVADAIVRNPQLASYAEIAEIALHADVNNSTVVRTAQSLGFRAGRTCSANCAHGTWRRSPPRTR